MLIVARVCMNELEGGRLDAAIFFLTHFVGRGGNVFSSNTAYSPFHITRVFFLVILLNMAGSNVLRGCVK